MNDDRRRLMSRTSLLTFACLCSLTLGNAGASTPEQSPQAIVEMRQQGFKKMGAAMKSIVEQLKSDAPDKARMAAAAQAISSSAEAQFGWFPAGTSADDGMETDALPHIWKDRARFDAMANRLIAESKNLATATSGNDVAAVKAQVKAMGDVCSSCHRSFRAD